MPAVEFASCMWFWSKEKRKFTKINVEPGEAGIICFLDIINFMVFRGGEGYGNQMKLKSNF